MSGEVFCTDTAVKFTLNKLMLKEFIKRILL